jgi:hypothetical protein
MVVAQTVPDPFLPIGGHTSTDAVIADDDSAVDLADRHTGASRMMESG